MSVQRATAIAYPWYAKHFPAGVIELRPAGGWPEFRDVFEAFAATRPGASIHRRVNADGSVWVYLSPECAEFAIMIGAKECESDLSMVGSEPLCGHGRN